MRVIVVKAFGVYSIGAVIPEMYAGQARTLIARGLVREDKDIEASPVNRMMGRAPIRKKA